jgi:hypothetical protein
MTGLRCRASSIRGGSAMVFPRPFAADAASGGSGEGGRKLMFRDGFRLFSGAEGVQA